jgi:hypothetical protein
MRNPVRTKIEMGHKVRLWTERGNPLRDMLEFCFYGHRAHRQYGGWIDMTKELFGYMVAQVWSHHHAR